MKVCIELPVPRRVKGYESALSWAADVFADFRSKGWEIEDVWMLELGSAWSAGRLSFKAVWGDAKAQRAGASLLAEEGDRIAIRQRANGVVEFDGALTENQAHIIRTALGGRLTP